MEYHMYILTAGGISAPKMLRLHVIFLQLHDHSLPKLCLWLPEQKHMRRERSKYTKHRYTNNRQSDTTMHTAHVPHQDPLARQDQLQRVLARKDVHHQFQLLR